MVYMAIYVYMLAYLVKYSAQVNSSYFIDCCATRGVITHAEA